VGMYSELDTGIMHASNLLKAVLKPRSISGSSQGQSLNSKDSKSRGNRGAAAPDSGLSLNVTKKGGPIPKPAVKMSCLCAPTNHAGSFRCRLHRGNQQSWGGRPVPAGTTTTSSKSPTAAASPAKAPSQTSVDASESANSRRVVPHPLPSSRPPMMSYSPPHRSSEVHRPSRLSRVSAASDVDAPVPQAAVPAPSPSPLVGKTTVRYLKFNPGAAASCGANGSVIDGGMSFVKKLQTGGKDVMHEVFGSGTAMSRTALSL
jgi:hypothetical protein